MNKKIVCRLSLVLMAAWVSGAAFAEAPNKASDDEFIKKRIDAAREAQNAKGAGFEMNGILEKGRMTRFSVNGEDFVIDTATQIEGSPSEGKAIHVVGVLKGNSKIAEQLVVVEVKQSMPNENLDKGR